MGTSRDPIVIIGAGVTGLSVATLLQARYPHDRIVIVAAETPTTMSPSADYASRWAGAHYRPIPASTRQLQQEADMAWRTAEKMQGIARDTPEAGVEVMMGVEFLEAPPPEVLRLRTGDVYAGPGDDFRVLGSHELPAGIQWGCEYRSYCVNINAYCRWLLNRFLANGGRIIQSRLSQAHQAFDVADTHGLGRISTVINCSGRNFDQDGAMKIMRGQTVLVRQQYDKTVTRQNRDGSWTFLVPRPRGGGTVVGGTREIGDLETQARPPTRELLLRRCVASFPDFVDSINKFEVVMDNVGRRPWRDGGYRIEIERVGRDRHIVHGYGAGGRGYELSWGAAEKVVELVNQLRRDGGTSNAHL